MEASFQSTISSTGSALGGPATLTLPRLDDAEGLCIESRASEPTASSRRAGPRRIPQQPKQSRTVVCNNNANAAMLLKGVVDGSMTSGSFARALEARAGDTNFYVALGVSLRELGHLMEHSESDALHRQRAATAAATRAAQQRLDELEECATERDVYRKRVANLEAEVERLRDELHSMFVPQEKSADDAHSPTRQGSRFAAVVRRATEHDRVERRAAALFAAAKPAHEPLPRAARIALQTKTLAQHESAARSRLEMVRRSHEESMERMRERMREERKQHEHAFTAREESAERRRKAEATRLSTAEREASVCKLRHSQSRAQAAAAVEVLVETQTEVRVLRAEVERLRLALDRERAARLDALPPAGAEEALGPLAEPPAACGGVGLGFSVGDNNGDSPAPAPVASLLLGLRPPLSSPVIGATAPPADRRLSPLVPRAAAERACSDDGETPAADEKPAADQKPAADEKPAPQRIRPAARSSGPSLDPRQHIRKACSSSSSAGSPSGSPSVAPFATSSSASPDSQSHRGTDSSAEASPSPSY